MLLPECVTEPWTDRYCPSQLDRAGSPPLVKTW